MLGQAGHETGWGKFEIKQGRRPSFNLFSIKAGPGWTGKVAELPDISGVAEKVAKFRAYNRMKIPAGLQTDFRQPALRQSKAQTGSVRTFASCLQSRLRHDQYAAKLVGHQHHVAIAPRAGLIGHRQSILNIGTRTLLELRVALRTAGNNIANVSTWAIRGRSFWNGAGQFTGRGYIVRRVHPDHSAQLRCLPDAPVGAGSLTSP